MITFIIYKVGLYTIKKSLEYTIHDTPILDKLKYYRAGNINWHKLVKYSTDALLILI